MKGSIKDRVISLGAGLAFIPERLLLSHAKGEVLFVAGAGVSKQAKVPDFRKLVIKVYESLDKSVHPILDSIPYADIDEYHKILNVLTPGQAAEIERFVAKDYDVVLGMLERRIDKDYHAESQVRKTVAGILKSPSFKSAAIHKHLMKLSDRGGVTTILTTNFERLLEKSIRIPAVDSYSLDGIPRPSLRQDFAGVLHIHGSLENKGKKFSDFIISDRDFGEYYLRRRTVPDLIYDAARLYNLVLVGYSANDPPMRYLLNAVAADGSRFTDLKERFAFVGAEIYDPILIEDWKGRGITPITYDSKSDHLVLTETLQRWADVSPINGKSSLVDKELKRIVKTKRSITGDEDRDFFDHIVRRSDKKERERITNLITKQKAEFAWFESILDITNEID